ncbi:MAG: hypothetical protein IPH29_08480 [Candidatus Microthrix sp.]|nr:hypothetical protein [Candidatus Microthrix sp.]
MCAQTGGRQRAAQLRADVGRRPEAATATLKGTSRSKRPVTVDLGDGTPVEATEVDLDLRSPVT